MNFEFITDEEQREQAIAIHTNAINELNDANKLKLDEEVSGLKSKVAEILDEKKQFEKKLKEFEGFDMESAKEAMDFLQNNKDAQLIKDGKVEELIQKRTSQLVSDHETKMIEMTSIIKEAQQKGDLYEQLYNTKMVDDGLREAAVEAKIRPEAILDVLLHGRAIFQLAEDGSLEARDKDGKLRKTADDKVLTTKNWIEGLKKTAPHYWPMSEGTGAIGGFNDGDAVENAVTDAAEKGDMTSFRRLRKKQRSV